MHFGGYKIFMSLRQKRASSSLGMSGGGRLVGRVPKTADARHRNKIIQQNPVFISFQVRKYKALRFLTVYSMIIEVILVMGLTNRKVYFKMLMEPDFGPQPCSTPDSRLFPKRSDDEARSSSGPLSWQRQFLLSRRKSGRRRERGRQRPIKANYKRNQEFDVQAVL
nr:uncharacterized protein LOC108070877 [Drosophila kikkawai]